MSRENFKIVKRLTPRYNIPYGEWQEIREDHILKPRHVGSRVWVAGFMSTSKMYLWKCHYKGEPLYPDEDAYTIVTDDSVRRTFFAKSCRLHPIEYRKRRRSKKKNDE